MLSNRLNSHFLFSRNPILAECTCNINALRLMHLDCKTYLTPWSWWRWWCWGLILSPCHNPNPDPTLGSKLLASAEISSWHQWEFFPRATVWTWTGLGLWWGQMTKFFPSCHGSDSDHIKYTQADAIENNTSAMGPKLLLTWHIVLAWMGVGMSDI